MAARRNRVGRLLNAPMTIGLLSLAVGGIAGTYWTERSACLAEGRVEWAQLTALQEEYEGRVYLLAKSLNDPKDDIAKTIYTYWNQGPFINKDFAQTGLHQLENNYLALRRRTLNPTRHAYDLAASDNVMLQKLDPTKILPPAALFSALDPAETETVFENTAKSSPGALSARTVQILDAILLDGALIAKNAWRPHCGIAVIIDRLNSNIDAVPLVPGD